MIFKPLGTRVVLGRKALVLQYAPNLKRDRMNEQSRE